MEKSLELFAALCDRYFNHRASLCLSIQKNATGVFSTAVSLNPPELLKPGTLQ
jgi:hypothetical protein